MNEERKRFDASQGPQIVGPGDGKVVELGSMGARFMAWAEETGGGFSLVEHPMLPRTLAAPLHKHSARGRVRLRPRGTHGRPARRRRHRRGDGRFAFKPRDQWHTFWNAGDEPCRILEIISPGGFEGYFDELAEVLRSPELDPPASAR